MGGAWRLCPPLNYTYEISGKFASGIMRGLSVGILPCNSSSNTSRQCANDTFIDDLITLAGGQLYAHLIYINPLINPGSDNYLSYYVSDLNYIAFSKQNGAFSNAYLE